MKLSKIKKNIPIELYSVLEKEIKELRPCQEKAVKAGLLDSTNLLVCTPTASGKTLIAEIAAVKAILEKKSKAIYIVPLKALASEKFNSFKQKYPFLNIALSIGDKDAADSYLEKHDIIICTSEKLDSLIRHHAPWLKQVSTIIVDEIHLLNDASRGPTLEILITILRSLLKHIQIIGLSATIGNPYELAQWLDAKLVEDDFRPVKLYEGILFENEIDFYGEKEKSKIKEAEDDATALALDIISKNKQAIMFVKSKAEAEASAERVAKAVKEIRHLNLSEKILKALGNPTRQCKRLSKVIGKGIAFHHSGLVQKQRNLIEEKFREGEVKVICATPTISMGLDLPCFRAILKDLRRYSGSWGLQWIPVLEYHQFSGRAGRPGKDDFGEAVAIAKNEKEKEEIYKRYYLGQIEDIFSKLVSEPILRMHLLGLIASEFVNSQDEIMNFFKKTFWAYQYSDTWELEVLIEQVLNALENYGFIVQKDFISATQLGKRVAELYIDPLTAYHMIQCIKNSENVEADEFSILQSVCNTLEMNVSSVKVKDWFEMEERLAQYEEKLLQKIPVVDSIEYELFLSSAKLAFIMLAWIEEADEDYLITEYNIRPGEMRGKLEVLDWLLYCVYELCKMLDQRKLLNQTTELRKRVKYGIKKELLELIRLKGIGRVRARMLFGNGIKNLKEVKYAPLDRLAKIIGNSIAKDVKEQLGVKVDKIMKEEGQKTLKNF